MKIILLFAFILLSFVSQAQSKWRNYAAIYFTGDASMYYLGPSFQIGTDYLLSKSLNISSYAHYFHRDMGIEEKFETLSIATLFQCNFGDEKFKRFYVAWGLAWQRTTEWYDGQYEIDRSVIVPAFRTGYIIPIKNLALCTEICTTGPYSTTGYVELITLPSIGLRVFRWQNSRAERPRN